MYEIISTTYGVVPTEAQYKAIENHYGDWPEHLGKDPYNGASDNSGFIGVNLNSYDCCNLHKQKLMRL